MNNLSDDTVVPATALSSLGRRAGRAGIVALFLFGPMAITCSGPQDAAVEEQPTAVTGQNGRTAEESPVAADAAAREAYREDVEATVTLASTRLQRAVDGAETATVRDAVSESTREIDALAVPPREPHRVRRARPQQPIADSGVARDEQRTVEEPPTYLRRPCRSELNGLCLRRDLDRFFEKLRDARLGIGDDPAVYTQWGDSLILNDHLTGRLRQRLQAEFGDAGHGFIYVGNPVRQMGFRDLRLAVSSRWHARNMVVNSEDAGNLFGIAGAELIPNGSPTLTLISTGETPGDRIGRLGLLYRAPENVIPLPLRVVSTVGEQLVELQPAGTEPVDALTWFEAGDRPSRVALGGFDPRLRFYGVIAQIEGPGVIVDNMGLVSARFRHLLKIDREQWSRQIELRDPDVMSFWYGTNSTGNSAAGFAQQRQEYIDTAFAVLERVRQDHADRDCLVVPAGLRGHRHAGAPQIHSALDPVAQTQREIASAFKCAFFDVRQFIVDTGGFESWRRARPMLFGDDLHHFTVSGYWVIADRLFEELMREFDAYLIERQERVDAGFPPYLELTAPR